MMSLEKIALRKKPWLVGLVAGASMYSQILVLRAAGLPTELERLYSPMALVHVLVLAGLFFLYLELVAFLATYLWPKFVQRSPATKG